MLTQRAPVLARFTRNDAARLVVAATGLIVALTAIFAVDIIPGDAVRYEVGQVVREDIVAPRPVAFESANRTEEARAAARAAVAPQYDYTADKAIAIAAEQAAAFDERVRRVDTAFGSELTPEERAALLETAIPTLSGDVTGRIARARRSPLDRGPHRGGARPRCHDPHRAARHRGGRHSRRHRGAHGWRP